MNYKYSEIDKSQLLEQGSNYLEEIERLVKILIVLRKECPWDRKQTHQSLRNCIIEETYEVTEAIDKKDYHNLKEELGDVLLQILFHSNLANEKGFFTLEEVVREENDKMIRRHPHVFSEEKIKTVDKVVEKWENIKREEKANLSFYQELENIPLALPALLRSYKLQKKASSIGFDWPDMEGARLKLSEELNELDEAISLGNDKEIEEEYGDLLFSIVNLGRFLKLNPEESLTKACNKFLARFSKMDDLAKSNGLSLEGLSLYEMDELWDEAKKILKK